MEKFKALLEKSCVKILSAQGNLLGSGFFISKTEVLTAGHVVKGASGCIIHYPEIEKSYSGFEIKYSDFDYAIIKILDSDPIQCVFLGTDINLNDDLLAYGYSAENLYGENLILTLEGASSNKEGVFKLKMKNGQVSKGNSGSPVLCLQSGQVIGIICETRSRLSAEGGYFVGMETVFSEHSALRLDNREWHLQNPSWNRAFDLEQTELSLRNETWKKAHFDVFYGHHYDVEDILIQPSYRDIVNKFEDFSAQQNQVNFFERCAKILKEQSVLLLTGPYGSGKTLLTKCLQKRLIRNGHNTLFIAANTFRNEHNKYHDLKQSLIKRMHNQSNLYVLIDAFDELQSLEGDQGLELFEDLVSLVSERGGYLIVNYRTLMSDDFKEQYGYLTLLLRTALNCAEIKMINLVEFGNSEIEKWMENYSRLRTRDGDQNVLRMEDIRNTHKHFIYGCHNPLFLYIVNQYYYNQGKDINSIENIYDLYAKFVGDTVRGKFSMETSVGAKALQQIVSYYLDFLKEIALNIASHSPKFAGSNVDADNFLDDNIELMGIPENKTADAVKEIFNVLIPYSEDFKSKKIDRVLLNCYFFEQTNGVWRFRDNNILYYFISEKLFSCISRTITAVDELKSLPEIFGELKPAATVPLHPVVIELLLRKTAAIKEKDRITFVSALRDLISNEFILSVPPNQSELHIDQYKINLDIFLCILFVQLNQESYTGLTFFFKRFTWLLSIVKRVNHKMVGLAKRFYKGARIIDAEFRRVNLKDCNFDQTYLKKVTFIQTKLYDVRKDNSAFVSVKYLLCDFAYTHMNQINGDIVFESCIINSLKFDENRGAIFLTFENCRIEHLEIFGNKGNKVYLKFKNCTLVNVLVKDARVKQLYLETNRIEHFQIETSKVNLMMIANKFKDEEDQFDIKHKVDIIESYFKPEDMVYPVKETSDRVS
ncbi:serine protease [Mucilaginibacter polytrichastri]|uniref:Novel STAND NTPase 3 domain-containing protein n=1 Tax=Mucilaginibacter polytrichastri TaxID=1302689 RepID=A0A1Q5ZY89_9SPHI|nr:trypsin-like peptidase domain-containing protein [Mucilaginibacter polytrichastri]OKS86730.1 hypothetical protein RG47T_2187 [Mucilaginibacter polytrichastri]SFS82831.1 IstB-like ATP binding protein [Mucilaginibacter polytrichastri]